MAVAQAGMNVAASLGAIAGPLTIGALTRDNPGNGWRKFYVRSLCALLPWGMS